MYVFTDQYHCWIGKQNSNCTANIEFNVTEAKLEIFQFKKKKNIGTLKRAFLFFHLQKVRKKIVLANGK